MSRVVVAGGAGFLGSHLIDSLLQDGHEVVCLDNLITGNPTNLAHLDDEPRFTFVQHDITTPIDLDGPVNTVYNLASPASPPDYLKHPIHTMKVGALGTLHLLGLAKAKDASFLLASTSEVYGDPEVHPQPESYWGNVHTVGPRGVYDEAKRFAESLTMSYHREHGLRTRIARIFNTYGPRMRPKDGRVIPNFFAQAIAGEPLTIYGDGSQTRSYCYVEDLVRGLRLLMDQEDPFPVNLGNPHELTVLQLAEEILRVAESDSELVHRDLPVDDPKQRRPDITRAKEVLGWEPAVSFADGMRQTYEHFRSIPATTGKEAEVSP